MNQPSYRFGHFHMETPPLESHPIPYQSDKGLFDVTIVGFDTERAKARDLKREIRDIGGAYAGHLTTGQEVDELVASLEEAGKYPKEHVSLPAGLIIVQPDIGCTKDLLNSYAREHYIQPEAEVKIGQLVNALAGHETLRHIDTLSTELGGVALFGDGSIKLEMEETLRETVLSTLNG